MGCSLGCLRREGLNWQRKVTTKELRWLSRLRFTSFSLSVKKGSGLFYYTPRSSGLPQGSAQPGNLDAGLKSVCLSFPSFSADNGCYFFPRNWLQLRRFISSLSPLTSPCLHCFLLVPGPPVSLLLQPLCMRLQSHLPWLRHNRVTLFWGAHNGSTLFGQPCFISPA